MGASSSTWASARATSSGRRRSPRWWFGSTAVASRGWGNRFAIHGDATRLSFQARQFDGVHCSHVIEHLHAPELFVREIARILKPGGVMMVRTPDIRRAGFRFYVDHTNRHPCTEQSLRGLLTSEGFDDLRFAHGPLHTTRLEMLVQRVLHPPAPLLYRVKRWLGQRWNDKLVCVATMRA